MSNMKTSFNCFPSSRQYEQQQQQQRLGSWPSCKLNLKLSKRDRYSTSSRILSRFGLCHRSLKFGYPDNVNLDLECDDLQVNWARLQHRCISAKTTTRISGETKYRHSRSNSKFGNLISTTNSGTSLSPKVDNKRPKTSINDADLTVNQRTIYTDFDKLDNAYPFRNCNNNSGGSGNKHQRKRSRRTLALLRLLNSDSEQSRNVSRDENSRFSTIVPRLMLRILGYSDQISAAAVNGALDSVMGSGSSGPKQRSPAPKNGGPTNVVHGGPTNVVNSATVGVAKVKTDRSNRPSMPGKNEQMNSNNSKTTAASVTSDELLVNCSNTSDASKTNQQDNQLNEFSTFAEDDTCKSYSLCTCRPLSGGGTLRRTKPPTYEIYGYLDSIFRVEGREVDYVQGDGNCFFRALSKQIYNSEDCHFELRQTILELMARHRSEFEQFTDTQDFSTHIREMRKFAVWATTAEIYGAATLLQRDIYVFSPDHTGSLYRWLLFSPRFPQDSHLDSPCQQCYITLCHTNGNHYDRVISLDASCNCALIHPQLAGRSFTIDLVCDKNSNNSNQESVVLEGDNSNQKSVVLEGDEIDLTLGPEE